MRSVLLFHLLLRQLVHPSKMLDASSCLLLRLSKALLRIDDWTGVWRGMVELRLEDAADHGDEVWWATTVWQRLRPVLLHERLLGGGVDSGVGSGVGGLLVVLRSRHDCFESGCALMLDLA